MFVHLGDELRLMPGRGERASQIHLHSQVCPCSAAELMGHLIGFTVTLGGFKVDGKGQNRAVGYGYQISAFIFGFLATSVQFPAISIVTDRSNNFYKLVNEFGSKAKAMRRSRSLSKGDCPKYILCVIFIRCTSFARSIENCEEDM